MLIGVLSDTQPTQLYLYNRTISDESKAITFLFSSFEKLENYTLSPVYAVEVPVSDGLTEVCYYMLPLESDPNKTGIPT